MPFEPFDATHASRRNMLKDGDWALCIGAGVCSGLMPDWALVTRQIIARACKSLVSQNDLLALQQQLGWSLDSLIQNALNLYLLAGRGIDDFYSDLADELYGQILSEASAVGLREALVELLVNPFTRNPDTVL